MELIDAYPLYAYIRRVVIILTYKSRQVSEHPSPGSLYSTLMDLIVRFAHAGLIHGDFNEFNVLIHRVTGEPIVIDFPQMVSTRHANAEFYFNRDVECIKTFFSRRFGYQSMLWPRFSRTIKEGEEDNESFRLDVVVAASGFGRKDQEELEKVRFYWLASCATHGLAQYMETQEEEAEGPQSESDEDSEEEEDDADPGTPRDVVPESASAEEERDIKNSPNDDSRNDDASSDSHSERSEEPVVPKRSKPKARQETDVKELVSSELSKQRTRQEKRYHSKNSIGKPGRNKGSKMKSDKKIRVNDGWD